jgi:cell wall-associated NlpC family hydrolase
VTNNNLLGLGFIWGGTLYADGTLEKAKGTKTITVTGNPTGNNYLNVILDTTTFPHSNHLYPSWGTITLKDVKLDTVLGDQAAELAKKVVGGDYTLGAKGWEMVEKRFLEVQEIKDSITYNYWNSKLPGLDKGKGLDCAGLVLWSYNKAAGATQLTSNGPIKYEGADGQYRNCTESINEADLRPGDLLFFDKDNNGEMDHVAMYVGNVNGYDVVHASQPGVGIAWAKKSDLKNIKGYGRVVPCQANIRFAAKSPVHLIVTDPDGNTIDSSLVFETDEERLTEIPGELYYSVDNDFDDMVTSPILKPGTYFVKVVPKVDAAPTDTYSLEVEGASKLVILAQDIPVAEIPPQGYAVFSTGNEIVPLPVVNEGPALFTPEDQIVQYSDLLSFDITATDSDDASNTLIFSATGLPGDLVLTDNGDGTATIAGVANVAPNTYPAQITVTDPGGLSDTKPVNIVVTQEDARTTYTGPLMVSTGCATCSTATIPLRATIQDITAVLGDPAYDPDAGNITNAMVSFVDRNNVNEVLCTSNVILLDEANPTVGTATCNWTANIGSSYGVDYTVGTFVYGYYTRNSLADDAVVVVSKPTSNFITGGGYFINQSSGGTYAGDPELKTNFGLNIKFTKKLTNLQGRVTIIVRQGERVYQIKSTALNSLVVVPFSPSNARSGVAELVSKATVIDVTDPLNPVTVAGNAILNVVMKDNGEPGSADLIGISLWSKDGELLFSNNWDGTQTVKVTLDGGNLSVK